MQPPQVVEDLSEDELSRDPAIQLSARKTNKTVTLRSPSPNAITSTHFTKLAESTKPMKPTKPKKPEAQENLVFHLSALRMAGGDWRNLDLIYSSEHKFIQFTKNGDMLHYRGAKIQLSSIHANTVYWDTESSMEVILFGAKGGVSRGRILFDFDTVDARNAFVEAVHDMSARSQLKGVDS
jgi:hypothetical protein